MFLHRPYLNLFHDAKGMHGRIDPGTGAAVAEVRRKTDGDDPVAATRVPLRRVTPAVLAGTIVADRFATMVR